MDNSILNSVKSKVNLTPDNTEFDNEIIDYINSAFGTLNQLGIGPVYGFEIHDATTTWDDFLKGDLRFNPVKDYVAKKVRMSFDLPPTSFAIDALKQSISELEWRLNTAREYTVYGIIQTGATPPPSTGGTTPPPSTDGGGPDSVSDTVLDGGAP